jgi:hypothetical protein
MGIGKNMIAHGLEIAEIAAVYRVHVCSGPNP